MRGMVAKFQNRCLLNIIQDFKKENELLNQGHFQTCVSVLKVRCNP